MSEVPSMFCEWNPVTTVTESNLHTRMLLLRG